MQLFKRVLLPFLWGKGTFSVPSLKGERQFDFLLNKLIDNNLHLLNKLIDKDLQ